MSRPTHRHQGATRRRDCRLQRNASGARIKWMFTTEKARAKIGRAYPQPAGAAILGAMIVNARLSAAASVFAENRSQGPVCGQGATELILSTLRPVEN